MAEDLGSIISNYGDMSIEELGGSLLQRQSDQQAAQAKEDKKNRRFQQALGVLTAGQAVFKGAAKRRLKEVDDLKLFEMANNESQVKDINNISNILSIMPEEWHEDKPLEERVDLFMESDFANALGAKLRKPIDATIEAASPYDPATFKQDGVYYQQTFDLALRNTVTDYLQDNKYKKVQTQLSELMGQPDVVKAISDGMGMTAHQLSRYEAAYYEKIKSDYSNIGIVDGIKNIFEKVGIMQSDTGRLNQFKNIKNQDLYGNDFDDSLANLNLRTTLIKSVDKSFADFRKDTRRFAVEVRDPLNAGLVQQSASALDNFGTRMNDRSIAKKNEFMNMAMGTKPGMMLRNRGNMYSRYISDLTEGEKQEMVNDIASTSLLLNAEPELAEQIYISKLKEMDVEPTESKIKIFRSNMKDDTVRLEFAVAIASSEGLKSSGVYARENYDYNGILEEKIIGKYSYDRFSGELPGLLGDGITTPKESTTNEFSIDDSWNKLSVDNQREVFDLHFKNISNFKGRESQKELLHDNLFENIPHPDGFNFEEYVMSKKPTNTQTILSGAARIFGSPGSLASNTAREATRFMKTDTRDIDEGKIIKQQQKVTDLKEDTSTNSSVLEKQKEKLFKLKVNNSKEPTVTLLSGDEGYRTKVYLDGKKGQKEKRNATVGIGHKLTKEELLIYKEGDYVPTDVIQKWFKEDSLKAGKEALQIAEEMGFADKPLYLEHKEKWTGLTFQMGKEGALDFVNMFEAIQRGDAQAAYDEALDSKWYKSDSPKRAKRFANFLLENVK